MYFHVLGACSSYGIYAGLFKALLDRSKTFLLLIKESHLYIDWYVLKIKLLNELHEDIDRNKDG